MSHQLNEYRVEEQVVWIKLTQGKETCIDLHNLPRVISFRWFARKNQSGIFYAYAMIPLHPNKDIGLHQILHGRGADHKDGNGLNNLESNLRDATPSQNNYNRKKSDGCTSSFKGVSRDKRAKAKNKPWRAHATINGRLKHLGCFFTEEEAARAYDKAALEHFPDFARLNFPTMVPTYTS